MCKTQKVHVGLYAYTSPPFIPVFTVCLWLRDLCCVGRVRMRTVLTDNLYTTTTTVYSCTQYYLKIRQREDYAYAYIYPPPPLERGRPVDTRGRHR